MYYRMNYLDLSPDDILQIINKRVFDAKIIEKSLLTLYYYHKMDTQIILVIVLSAGALSFLGIRFYKAISGKNKSGGWANCGGEDTKKIKPENLKMRLLFRGLRKFQKKDISELKNLNLVIIDHDAMMKRSKGVFDLKV